MIYMQNLLGRDSRSCPILKISMPAYQYKYIKRLQRDRKVVS